jgi:hypothetical protein
LAGSADSLRKATTASSCYLAKRGATDSLSRPLMPARSPSAPTKQIRDLLRVSRALFDRGEDFSQRQPRPAQAMVPTRKLRPTTVNGSQAHRSLRLPPLRPNRRRYHVETSFCLPDDYATRHRCEWGGARRRKDPQSVPALDRGCVGPRTMNLRRPVGGSA